MEAIMVLTPALFAVVFGVIFIYFGNYKHPEKTNGYWKATAFIVTTILFCVSYTIINGIRGSLTEFAIFVFAGIMASSITLVIHIGIVWAFKNSQTSSRLLVTLLLCITLLIDVCAIGSGISLATKIGSFSYYNNPIIWIFLVLILIPATTTIFVVWKEVKSESKLPKDENTN